MKRLGVGFFVFFFLVFGGVTVYAEGTVIDGVRGQLRDVETGELDAALQSFNLGAYSDFRGLVLKAVSGELDLSPKSLINAALSTLTSELAALGGLMRNLILIAVLSAFFKTLAANFSQKNVAEMGFYVNFIVIVTLVFSSFSICLGISRQLVGDLYALMQAFIPVMLTVAAMSGSVGALVGTTPLILLSANIMTRIVRDILGPLVTASLILHIVNYLAERDILTRFSNLIRNGISWGLKSFAALFLGVLTLQGISAPIMKNAAVSGAKTVVKLVPVVGGSLSAAVDTVFYYSGLLKSGVLVAIVLVVVALCAIPLIKISAFIIAYKFTAGLIEPIADERLVKAIDGCGNFAALVLGATFLVAVMFVIMTIIMLSI